MSKNEPAIAKITAPRVSGIVLRERLYRLLDNARKKSVTWVSAQGGAGKTTLLAGWIESRKIPCLWYQVDSGDNDPATFFSYLGQAARTVNPRRKKLLPPLTPEYLVDVPAFTRRYFEEMCRSIPGLVIVLDNCQELTDASPLHEILPHAAAVLTRGQSLVIISRTLPPVQYARLRANNVFSLIGWNEVRFTADEVGALVKTVRRGRCLELECPGPTRLYEKTDGWAAGLRLMLEAAEPQRAVVRASAHGTPVCHCVDSLAWTDNIFDYFAGEVLQRNDKQTRDFLLKTAFLPMFSVSDAAKLTGNSGAGRILSELNRHHYFTERLSVSGQVYQYHPLFRDFLISRAKTELAASQLSRTLEKAALLLEGSEQTGNAAALFNECRDWKNLSRVILCNAKNLLSEGRHKTLETWLSWLPAAILEKDPMLLYWLGVCKMVFSAPESRALLERAFKLFNARKEIQGALAAWSAIVDSIISENNDYSKLDPWIAWLERKESSVSRAAPEIESELVSAMLMALTFRQPSHSKLPVWAARAERLLKSRIDRAGMAIAGACVLHYTFSGAVHEAGYIINRIRRDARDAAVRPLMSVKWHAIKAIYAAYGSAEHETCLAAVREGLELSRKSGIPFFYPTLFVLGTICSIVSRNEADIDHYLGELTARKDGFNEMNRAYHYYLLAWRDLAKGDFANAAKSASMLLPLMEKLGHTQNVIMHHVGLSHALFELCRKDEARRSLASARRVARKASPWFNYMFLVTEAYFAFKSDDTSKGRSLLRKAMTIGRENGIMVYPYWTPRVMEYLCAQALDAGIEPDYVKTLIKTHNLKPGDREYDRENWPYPVRIYTRNGFRIVKDGKPLQFSRKVPKKPMELLKTLIALGGRDVPGGKDRRRALAGRRRRRRKQFL